MQKLRLPSVLLVAVLLLAPCLAQAEKVEEKPSAFAMAGDLLIARPLGLGMFALGSVTFVATLPFSLLGGNVGDAGKMLVVEPAEEVFVRCLGCTRPGRKEKIRD